jgi:septum formation protein
VDEVIWLASGSPRRRVLLTWAGVEVEVRPSDVDERLHDGEDPVAYAERLAASKAALAPSDRIVVAADTVVHADGVVFDKPADRREAVANLEALSGRWHGVTTGVCVGRGRDQRVFHTTTRVRFRVLSRAEIEAYVATGEADDKAGAYGIQGRAGAFVAEVQGSWTNVVGLPLEAVLPEIAALRAPQR